MTIALKGNRPETKRQALKSLKFSADECSFTWIWEVVKTTRVDLFAVVLIVHWAKVFHLSELDLISHCLESFNLSFMCL